MRSSRFLGSPPPVPSFRSVRRLYGSLFFEHPPPPPPGSFSFARHAYRSAPFKKGDSIKTKKVLTIEVFLLTFCFIPSSPFSSGVTFPACPSLLYSAVPPYPCTIHTKLERRARRCISGSVSSLLLIVVRDIPLYCPG